MCIIGKTVVVTVDRPLGSYHPQHKDIYYSVNYGYIEGILSPDGEFQDAYILGVSRPVKEFRGTVAAVIRRLDDVEDKWVVVPEGTVVSKENIKSAVHFQEQYFQYDLILENNLLDGHGR